MFRIETAPRALVAGGLPGFPCRFSQSMSPVTPVSHREFVNPSAARMTACFFWAVMRDETLALHAGFDADPATKALAAAYRGLLGVAP